MAPPSIRKGKRPTDDPITLRVKYMYGAAKAYETAAPVLAAYLGREALKISNGLSKALSRETRSLCPSCGYPWECSDQKRHASAPNAVRPSSCRLCGCTKSIKVHVDTLQVSKDLHSALEFQGHMLAEQLIQGKSPESCAADLPVIHCETAAESTSNLAHQSAAEAKGQNPPAPEAGDTGINMYHALSRAGNIPRTGLVAEPLVPSTAGMHRSQDTPGQQQACDGERTHLSGGPEQQHTTAEQSHCEDAREASLLPAEPLLAPTPGLDAETMTHSAGTASECRLEHGKVASSSGVAGAAGTTGTHEDFSSMTESAGAADEVQLDHGTIESSDGVGGAASTGEQEDIRLQVLHMMDESLPIAHAMQRAAERVKSNETGSEAAPRWSHRGRKGKNSAHRYRWLRVGRTWKKHAI